MSKPIRVLVSVVAAFVLVAAAVGVVVYRGGGGGDKEHEGEHEARGASHEMREALEKHPGLNKQRMMPLAFTSEKLAQQSGDPEATGEIQNGPNQESYDQRAYASDGHRCRPSSSEPHVRLTAVGREGEDGQRPASC